MNVSLDPDVAEQLEEFARRRNSSFDAALNQAVRNGMAAEQGFRVASRPMGLRPGIDFTHAIRLAGELEDEEILRKLNGS